MNKGGEPAPVAEATDHDIGPVITLLRRKILFEEGWKRSSVPPIFYRSDHYAVGVIALPPKDQLVEQLRLAGQVPWTLIEFLSHFFEGRSAEGEKLWDVAVDEYLTCWKLLTEMPPANKSVNLWLSLCVGTRLISVYQLRLSQYQKCLDIFDRLLTLFPARVISFEVLMHRSQVLYQWSCSVEDEAQKKDLLKSALELKKVVVPESSSIDLWVFFCLGLIKLLPRCSRISEARKYLEMVDQELINNCNIPLEWKLELEYQLAISTGWELGNMWQRLRDTKSKAEKNGIFIDGLGDMDMTTLELLFDDRLNQTQDARSRAVVGKIPEEPKKSEHSHLKRKDFENGMDFDSDFVAKSPKVCMSRYEVAGRECLKDASEYKGAFSRNAIKKQLTEAKEAIVWFEKSLRVIQDHPEKFQFVEGVEDYHRTVGLYRMCGVSCMKAAASTIILLLGVYKGRAEEDQLQWVQRVQRHLKQAAIYFAKAISSLESYGVTHRSAPRIFQTINTELSGVLCDMAIGKFWQGYYMALRGRYLRRKGIAMRRMYWRKGSTLCRSKRRVFSLGKVTEEVLWYLSSFRKAAHKAIEQFKLTVKQLDFALDRQAIMDRVEERASYLQHLIEVLGYKVRAQELQNDYEAWKKGMKNKIMKKMWKQAGEEKICCRKEVNEHHEKTPRLSRHNRLTLKQQQLVWVERSFATLFSYDSLARGSLLQEVQDLCRNYGTDDQLVWRTIMESQAACSSSSKAATFVVYRSKIYGLISPPKSYQQHVVYHITIFVITQTGKVVRRKTTALPPFVSMLQCITSRMSEEEMNDIDKSSSFSSARTEEHLEFLYKVLISPISDLLASVEQEDKLVFVADQALTLVPFSILIDPASKKFLFERHTISIAPSFIALVRGKQHFQALENCHTTMPSLVMGDPAYSVSKTGNFGRLEGSLAEIEAIRGSFEDIFIQKDSFATVENLVSLTKLPPDCKRLFIHLIVHGSLDDKSKQFYLQFATRRIRKRAPISPGSSSAIGELSRKGVRAGDEDSGDVTDDSSEEDNLELPHSSSHRSVLVKKPRMGRLWVEDVMQPGMNWSAHMVVLSACNSAKGQVLQSEGVLNMARAFTIAGVPCVVASQWKVDDVSAYLLMKDFYGFLRNGEDVDSALRSAMLLRVEDRAHLHQWGAFMVSGFPKAFTRPICVPRTLDTGNFILN